MLQFSNLTEINLKETSLKKANLQEANLQGVNLQCTNLSGASLLEANIQFADLENVNLEDAQFSEDVLLNQTNFKGANLNRATGLSSSQIGLAITDKQSFRNILKKKRMKIFFCNFKKLGDLILLVRARQQFYQFGGRRLKETK